MEGKPIKDRVVHFDTGSSIACGARYGWVAAVHDFGYVNCVGCRAWRVFNG